MVVVVVVMEGSCGDGVISGSGKGCNGDDDG